MNKYIFLILAITSVSIISLAQSQAEIQVEGVANNCFIPFEEKVQVALQDLSSNAEKECSRVKGYPERNPEVFLSEVGYCVVVAKSKFICRVN
jgi:hypothetical protein